MFFFCARDADLGHPNILNMNIEWSENIYTVLYILFIFYDQVQQEQQSSADSVQLSSDFRTTEHKDDVQPMPLNKVN